MAKLRVELVSPEREVWVGEADSVSAKTIEGELGILPQHAPVLGVLEDGSVVRIKPADGDADVAATVVGGGFFSVSDNEVSVLAERAELGSEIDVEAARRTLQEILAGERDEQTALAERRARARLRAAGQEV